MLYACLHFWGSGSLLGDSVLPDARTQLDISEFCIKSYVGQVFWVSARQNYAIY